MHVIDDTTLSVRPANEAKARLKAENGRTHARGLCIDFGSHGNVHRH